MEHVLGHMLKFVRMAGQGMSKRRESTATQSMKK